VCFNNFDTLILKKIKIQYILKQKTLLKNTLHHSFETRPGPAGRPRTGKEKPGMIRLTRQDPVANPLTFVFFTKTMSF
jgi:hypothetical protein